MQSRVQFLEVLNHIVVFCHQVQVLHTFQFKCTISLDRKTTDRCFLFTHFFCKVLHEISLIQFNSWIRTWKIILIYVKYLVDARVSVYKSHALHFWGGGGDGGEGWYIISTLCLTLFQFLGLIKWKRFNKHGIYSLCIIVSSFDYNSTPAKGIRKLIG